MTQTLQPGGVEVDWSATISDGKKNGLTTVDISIQSMLDKVQSSTDVNSTVEEAIINTTEDDEEVVLGITLTAEIPEKCNIKCMLHQGGDITVTGKLEGEDGFELMTSGGNIVVDKLRGDAIHLDSKYEGNAGGIIHVKKACEAQELNISVGAGGRLRAKMLNVSNANIEVEDAGLEFGKMDDDDGMALIDVGSIYTSQAGEGAHLVVSKSEMSRSDSIKKVRVKSNHGHISVRTASSFSPNDSSIVDDYGQKMAHVELGGVNGSFDVSVEKFGVENVFSKAEDGSMPMAAKVHVDSLSPGQASILTSDYGDVGVTLDRKIESEIRLLSTPLVNNLDPNVLLDEDENELVAALAEHDDDVDGLMISLEQNYAGAPEESLRITLETEAFSGRRNCDMKHVEYVQGVIENKSREPNSRFDVKTKGLASSVGKIRIEGAARQALQGFSGGEETMVDIPLLSVVTDGRIKVETLSWFGAIARRYGVEDEGRDLGRQATAGGAANAKKQ